MHDDVCLENEEVSGSGGGGGGGGTKIHSWDRCRLASQMVLCCAGAQAA